LTCEQDAIWKDGIPGCPAVFDPCLEDFDAVILLRRDSIPNADLALQLPSTREGAAATRQLPRLLIQAGFGGHEDDSVVPPSNARALLGTIPSRKTIFSPLSQDQPFYLDVKLHHGVLI